MNQKPCPDCHTPMKWDGLGWEYEECGKYLEPTSDEARQAAKKLWRKKC